MYVDLKCLSSCVDDGSFKIDKLLNIDMIRIWKGLKNKVVKNIQNAHHRLISAFSIINTKPTLKTIMQTNK